MLPLLSRRAPPPQAEALRGGRALPFSYTVEGELQATAHARLPENARAERVRFTVGDACAMPPMVAAGGPYHVIHVSARARAPQ